MPARPTVRLVPSLTVRAPAKVNLALRVGARRPDGFHDLATVFHAVNVYDELTARPADDLRLTMSGDIDGVPGGADNLAARAATMLAGRLGRDPAVALHLTKGIPVAGGLAGGSADAAAALVGCAALWDAELDRDELVELAGLLGSDVPFALLGGTAVGTGRGERLTAALARGRFHWVLAIADGGLSTPAVYTELDRRRGDRVVPEPRVDDAVMAALRAGDARSLAGALHNDLQDAACALRPSLRRTLDAGAEAGALAGVVSGSGPTVALLVRDERHAIDVAVAMSASATCRTVRRAYGPVAGARLVPGT